MEEKLEDNLHDKEILVVQDKNSKKLKIVASMDEEGNINKLDTVNDKPKKAIDEEESINTLPTVEAKKKNESKFLTFEKRDNLLENFVTNFLRQADNPSHTGFYRLSAKGAIETLKILEKMLKMPELNEAFISGLRIDPEKLLSNQKQVEDVKEVEQTKEVKQVNKEYKPIDESRIDWKQFEQLGLTKESLEKTDALKSMLNYRKTKTLIPITMTIGDMPISTDARLSLREMPDGRIVPNIHAIRVEPPLDRPFYGHTFTDEDRQNLKDTGNLGRTVDLKMPHSDNPVKCYVSIDKLTYDIVALDASKVSLPNDIRGLALSDRQKIDIGNGKAIDLNNIPSRNGGTFQAKIQVNADTQRLEYFYPSKIKHEQNQNNAPEKTIRFNDVMLGRPISPEEKERLQKGEVVFMKDLFKHGKHFDADVSANFEENRFNMKGTSFEKSNDIKVAMLRETKVHEPNSMEKDKDENQAHTNSHTDSQSKELKKQNGTPSKDVTKQNDDLAKKVIQKKGRKI